MVKKRISAFLVILLLAGVIYGVEAIQKDSLVKVDRSTVCMLKNRTLGKPFIPVTIDGKTYYGCCENCTATLQKEPKERFAADPITGRQVDKAAAVIGGLPGGEVLYFENEESFRAYSR